MAGLQTDILVNENYDRPYIYALWQRCRAIQEKRHLSQRQFYDKEIEPTLEYELKRIKIARDPKFQFEFPYVGPDRKIIRDFLSKGVAREFGLPIIQMIDAYVQLASPKFVTLVNAKDDLDKMGEIVGYFLRDPQVGELGYLLAQAKQKLLHFFSYDNVDTLGSYDDTTRYLCLFVGETPDYLFSLDFAFIDQDIAPLYDERLRLYYGFCAPGEDFSPLIMRSYCLRERLAGLLYSKSSLIDLSSKTLDELTFEVFTTDKAFHGGNNKSSEDMDEMSAAVQKAIMSVKGMKVGRHLNKISKNSEEYNFLNNRVNQFVVEFL